jgi:hypothetical protein
MENSVVRTTVNLKRETHAYVREFARANGLSLGSAIDELIQKARVTAQAPTAEIRFLPNGFPIFPPTGRSITDEEVKRLEDEE